MWQMAASCITPQPQLLNNHCVGGRGSRREDRWHLLDHRHCVTFWESSFTFGGLKSLIAVTFLAQGYGRKYCMCIQKKVRKLLERCCPIESIPS